VGGNFAALNQGKANKIRPLTKNFPNSPAVKEDFAALFRIESPKTLCH
jgi:hypothetical protein